MRGRRWTLGQLVVLAIVVGLVTGWLFPARAQAAVNERHAYHAASCPGEFMSPGSRNARRCQHHGWIVNPVVVIGPNRWVRFDAMRRCATEDDNGTCVWWAAERGNHEGASFVHFFKGDRTVYVKGFWPCRCDDPGSMGDTYSSGA